MTSMYAMISIALGSICIGFGIFFILMFIKNKKISAAVVSAISIASGFYSIISGLVSVMMYLISVL